MKLLRLGAMLDNPSHEAFVQKWHETGNKSQAYRYAFPESVNWKDSTVHPRASTLSKETKVLARFKELQQESADNHGITVKSLLDELDEARTIALGAEKPQTAAAVSATMGKAKLCGMDKQVIEHKGAVSHLNANYDIKADDPKQASQEYLELLKGG